MARHREGSFGIFIMLEIGSNLAAGEGVGPSYRDSKSRVLPLDDPARKNI